MVIRPFSVADTDEVVRLWTDTGLTRPWNDPRKDIARKLTVQPELFLVAERDASIAGSAMAGFDGHRGWLYYFAVRPELQGRGIGRALLAEVEHRLTELGCPKLNLQVRADNERLLARYRAWGYAEDGATGLGKRLIPDE